MQPTQPPAHAHADDIWASCSAPNKKSICLPPSFFILLQRILYSRHKHLYKSLNNLRCNRSSERSCPLCYYRIKNPSVVLLSQMISDVQDEMNTHLIMTTFVRLYHDRNSTFVYPDEAE